MSSNIHPFYSHSGRFGVHGPLLAILAAIFVAYPLGIAYAYLMKWIPFVYLNALIAIGYGLVFGFLSSLLLQFAKVRNNLVTLVTGMAVGLIAWYGSWNGCAKALIGADAPALLMPWQMWRFVTILNEHGSWGIGFSSSEPVTGVLLAIFWILEGITVVGIAAVLPYTTISKTPFCENHGCWLNKEKKIDKLAAFIQPDQIAAFKAGDIAPLDRAQPRVPAAGQFARLTLRYSPECHEFCTLSIANVTIEMDKNGNPKEKVHEIMTNLLVPKTMFEYLESFEHVTARPAATV